MYQRISEAVQDAGMDRPKAEFPAVHLDPRNKTTRISIQPLPPRTRTLALSSQTKQARRERTPSGTWSNWSRHPTTPPRPADYCFNMAAWGYKNETVERARRVVQGTPPLARSPSSSVSQQIARRLPLSQIHSGRLADAVNCLTGRVDWLWSEKASLSNWQLAA
jgi:hypothetical protein